MSNAANEPRRWTLVGGASEHGLRVFVAAKQSAPCYAAPGEEVPVIEASAYDALLAENTRLVAGLESIANEGTSETADGTMLAPGALQARIVLDGSTRPLERYTERIAALLAERDALKVEVKRIRDECDEGRCPSAEHERLAAAALRERARTMGARLRQWAEREQECISGACAFNDPASPGHSPDCPAHPDFLTTSATESREAKGGTT